MKQSTREWLHAAQEDLIVIESIQDSELATGAASFHAQQCVEKCLKALLEENEDNVPRIHDLERLFSMTESYLTVDINEEIVDKLSTLYIESRYPGAFGLLPNRRPALEDVTEFYNFARSIFESVTTHLECEDNT